MIRPRLALLLIACCSTLHAQDTPSTAAPRKAAAIQRGGQDVNQFLPIFQR